MADQIKHVIVLILENRSFDHMLGDLQQHNSQIDGIDRNNPNSNTYEGVIYLQELGAPRFVSPDPKHEYEHVIKQIKNGNAGFVSDFADAHPHATQEERTQVMRHHELGSLTALHTLARHFLVCDHWYASVPGPTWPNRLFAMSGTSLGLLPCPRGCLAGTCIGMTNRQSSIG